MCVCVCVCVKVCVSTCVCGRITTWSMQLWKQVIWTKRSCSLHVPWAWACIVIWPLFRKMPINQKPLNRIRIFWYHFTPRKLLYLMVSINLVKFGPHGLSVFWGATLFWNVHVHSKNQKTSNLFKIALKGRWSVSNEWSLVGAICTKAFW